MHAFDVLMRWFDVVAQLTALSVLLGPMKKYVPSPGLTRFVLGGACGGFSSLEMLQPLIAAPGITLDLLTLPVAIAAGFLGRGGGIAALAVALVTSVSIGGVGAYAGVLGLIVVAFAGLFWARRFGLDGKHSLAQLMLLGVVPSLSLPFFLIIPGSVGWGLLQATLPIYVPLNMADSCHAASCQRCTWWTSIISRKLTTNTVMPGGDQVLVSVARRIVSEVGSQALIARLGGDEFAVVRLVSSESHGDDLVDRLIKKVRSTPIPLICGATVTASVSIGSARWISGESAHSLLIRADQSLYGAKASAKSRRSTQKRKISVTV